MLVRAIRNMAGNSAAAVWLSRLLSASQGHWFCTPRLGVWLGLARLCLLLAAFCLGAVGAAKAEVPASAPVGKWLTADHSAIIRIEPCKAGLCGRIVGIHLKHAGDPMPLDWRGRPQCGLTMIEARPETSDSGKTIWKGFVLDPRNGHVHPALLTPNPPGQLILRGYMLIPLLGRSQVWTAYDGPTLPDCHLPGNAVRAG